MNFWEQFFKSGTCIECPGQFVLGAGKRTWTEKELEGGMNFYFPDFFLRNTLPFFQQEEVRIVAKDELSDVLNSKQKNANLFDWKSPDYEKYQSQYETLYELLESNFLKKAVLYSIKEANLHLDEKMVTTILSAALNNKGHALLYGFWDQNEGMIGVTPEILFEKNAEGIFLEAIAGTKLNSSFSEKEDIEHQIVIDGIQEALLPFGEVRSFPRRIIPYGNLTHLLTPLKLEPNKKVTFQDLVRCLHPTPALGTYPKDAGLPWLKEVDAIIPRNRYGAPAGFVHEGIGRCLVAIRNIQWKEGTATMAAGGGITIDSKKESEWEEIMRKFNAIQRILNI